MYARLIAPVRRSRDRVRVQAARSWRPRWPRDQRARPTVWRASPRGTAPRATSRRQPHHARCARSSRASPSTGPTSTRAERDRARPGVRRPGGRPGPARRKPAMSGSIFDVHRDLLACAVPARAARPIAAEQLDFVGKFQQITGPITAKGSRTPPSTATTVWSRSTRWAGARAASGSPSPSFTG